MSTLALLSDSLQSAIALRSTTPVRNGISIATSNIGLANIVDKDELKDKIKETRASLKFKCMKINYDLKNTPFLKMLNEMITPNKYQANSSTKKDIFSTLPNEALHLIIDNLPANKIKDFSLTCRRFYNLSKNNFYAKEVQRFKQIISSPNYLSAIYIFKHAIENNHINDIRIMLELGFISKKSNINTKDLLVNALENGNNEIVKLFMQHGANPNAKLCGGETPLSKAISIEKLNIIKELLIHGADPNAKLCGGETPLSEAISIEKLNIIKELLIHGADPNAKLCGSETPLSKAISIGNSDIIHELLAHGADPEARLCGGATPLTRALAMENNEVVNTLVNFRAE